MDERAFDLVAEMAPHAFVEPIPGLARIGTLAPPTATPQSNSSSSTSSTQEPSKGTGSAAAKLQVEEILADILGA